MIIGWGFVVLVAALPHLALAILFFVYGGGATLAIVLGVYCLFFLKDDHTFFLHAFNGLKSVIVFLCRVTLSSLMENVRGWVDVVFLFLHGREFYVVDVVEVEVEKVVETLKFQTVRVKEMSTRDAMNCLRLVEGEELSADDVNAAYRNMIKHVHPDVGGSNYLAWTVKEARDKLLKVLS